MGKLTALQVKNAKPGERLADGDGLRLDVDDAGRGAWILRFTSPATGRERFMGLGPERDVKLAAARDAAQTARALIRQGVDPIEHRRAGRVAAKIEASRTVTFHAYAERFISARETAWKNAKHRQQWRNSLATYAYPQIGALPVADVDTAAVLGVLRPIWQKKPETASRLRGRIEAILSAAKAEKFRTGENPAGWRGHLDQLFPSKKKVRGVKHHAALPYAEIPAMWQTLQADKSEAARLLRFIILTAARYGEAASADWSEIDTARRLWTVPRERTKAGRPHIVPLSEAALAEVGEKRSGLLFPSPMTHRPISDVALADCIGRHARTAATTHGFRSTFRDWAGDCSEFPREVAEAALAHAIGDETEAAYRRGTALAKRRELMGAWAHYVGHARPR